MESNNNLTWPSTDAWGIPLVDPVSVNHEGKVIVIAREAGQPASAIYYNVKLPKTDSVDDNLDWSGWYWIDLTEVDRETAIAGTSPDGAGSAPQLRLAGMDLITVPPLAESADPADAPFRALSADGYLYLFRQSEQGTLYVNRFVLVETPPASEGDAAQAVETTSFLLRPAWETRFRRSEKKDTPDGPKDTLSYQNMVGRPFHEPTIELATIQSVDAGQFSVLLLPTSDPGIYRWHVFVVDLPNNQVLISTMMRSSSGLFDFSPENLAQFTLTPALRLAAGETQTLTCGGGLDAALYFELEPFRETESNVETARRAGRVMLSLPVSDESQGLDAAMCVYVFGVKPDGTIPVFDGSNGAVLIDGTLEDGVFTPLTDEDGYPIPASAVSAVEDTTVSSIVLGQVQPTQPPLLVDGSDGLIHLYYAGQPAEDQNAQLETPFLVAQFNPISTRASVPHTWKAEDQEGIIAFVAQRTGSSMNDMTVDISEAGDGDPSQADLCDLAIDYGEASGIASESWSGVPREVHAFVAVLNGQASDEPNDPAVRTGEIPYYDYTGLHPMARLPVDSVAAATSWLTLVTRRADVALSAVDVELAEDGSEPPAFAMVPSRVRSGLRSVPVRDNPAILAQEATGTITLSFTASGQAVTQTWAGVLADTPSAVAVLDGTDSWYGYAPGADDTLVYGLSTDTGNDMPGSVLLFADPATLTAGAEFAVANSAAGESYCDISVTLGTAAPILLEAVLRTQDGVIEALMGNSEIAAAFFHISPDLVSGTMVNQVAASPLDLRARATLFDVVAPVAEGLLTDASISDALLQGHSSQSNQMTAMTAVPTTVPETGRLALVEDAAGQVEIPATNGFWEEAEPLYAIEFGTSNAMIVPLDTSESSALAPGRGWTVECWVQPSDGTTARILTYNDGSAPTPGGIVPTYLLGTTGLPSLVYGPYEGEVQGSYIQVDADDELLINDLRGFTFEAWIKPDDPPCPDDALASIIQGQDNAVAPDIPRYQLALTGARQLRFSYQYFDDENAGYQAFEVENGQPLTAGVWTHVAVTGEETDSGWNIMLYVNGMPALPEAAAGPAMEDTQRALFLCIGGYYNAASEPYSVSLFGTLAEIRYWSFRRTQAEIERTMRVSLNGYEPGLVGYWPLSYDVTDDTVVNEAKATGGALDGTIVDNSTQSITNNPDGKFLSIVAGVGGLDPILSNGFLQANEWNHVAMVLDAGTGLWLNPQESFEEGRLDWADCGNSSELNLSSAATLEAWIQIPDFNNAPNTILSKWGTQPQEQGYQFGLTDQGLLTCSVMLAVPDSDDPQDLAVTSEVDVADGEPHHVVAVFESLDDGTDGDNNPQSECSLTLYVDGLPVESSAETISGASVIQIQPTKTHFCLGLTCFTPYQTEAGPNCAVESESLLHGVLAGVRVWMEALTPTRVLAAFAMGRAYDNDEGLVSAWWFEEQKGQIAADSVSNNNAQLSNTSLWCLFEELSRLLTYSNGYLVGQTAPADSEMIEGYEGLRQFTAGAYYDGTSYSQGLNGELDELRLWNSRRTPEQLRDNMYRPLDGAEENLAAYWRFGQNTIDQAGAGNNGELVGDDLPAYTASAAPVANEGPWLRNIYGGQQTVYQEPLSGTPAVVEYSDLQRRSDGSTFTVMKRGYFWFNQSLTLQLGYKVGDLAQVYLGQVQTQPTLIGYIEGAPPVPSENLSRPLYKSPIAYFNYNSASRISLLQAASKSLSVYSSNLRSNRFRESEGGGGFFLNIGAEVGGLGFSMKNFSAYGKLGLQWKESELGADVGQASLSSGWTDEARDSMSLRGAWEPRQADPNDYLNPVVGRRYLPKNLGYALVESLTGDMYSLHMLSTGAMVGSVVVPNLKIPADKNIILFPISPTYVKNGTLDGKVGLANDPAYPGADIEPGSYFDSKEAYVLKDRIERETTNLETWYAQFDPKALVEEAQYDDGGQAEPVDKVKVDTGSAQEAQFYDWEKMAPRKSLCNTYVWTANGGLHREEQQVLSQRRESYGSCFTGSQLAGLHLEIEVSVSVGIYAGIDALDGHKVEVQVNQEQSQEAAFKLEVDVPGEPNLLAWDEELEEYGDRPTPGKVDAYRFMTFYLAPSLENASKFKEIVDQNWLRNSSDPNAVALRGAQIDSNEVWRVLHRVTYVSRIPPESNTVPDQSVGPVVEQPIVVEDNLLLIGLVQDALASDLPTPVNLGQAVAQVLNPPEDSETGEYPPSLLGEVVPWWESFLDTTRGTDADPEAQTLLYSIQLDTLAYMEKGFATGLLPI